MAEFDPYLKWLGIRSKGRAPNHYRLLGLDLFESDSDIIANAADRQISHVKTFQQGPEGDYAQDILNRLANAKLTLLKPEARAIYDQKLKVKIKALRAARAKAAGGSGVLSGSSGSGIDINPSLSGTQLPQPMAVPVAHPVGVPQPSVQQHVAPAVSTPAVSGSAGAAAIDQQPERKKRSPFVSLVLALLMWASSAVAAVVAGYFIINSSWFPGNQPDTEVAELSEEEKPFGISVVRGESKPLPDIDDVLGTDASSKKQPDKSTFRDKRPSEDPVFKGSNSRPKQPVKKKRNGNRPDNKQKVANVVPPFQPDTRKPTPQPVKAQPIVKSAEPERAVVSSLSQELKDLYKAGYSKDATPNQKKKLSESLLKDGLTTKEPAMQFAMIDQSIEVASSIADATIAVEALEAMDLRFEIDFWKRADEVIDKAKRKIKAPMQYKSTAAGIDKLLGRSLSESRFDEASAFASVGAILSRKFKDLKRMQRFDSLSKDLKDVRMIAKKAKSAEEKLANNPEDPAANLDRGNYLYLVKNDLRGAIEHWEKSSSEEYQMVAGLEAEANRSDGAQLLELALAWKKLGERLKTATDIKFSFRAKELCEKSAPLLDGLNKLKAENTVLELKEALKGKKAIDVATLASSDMPSTGSPFLDAVYKHDWSIDFYSSTIPDLQKATFLPTGAAVMVTTKGASYQVMFEVDGDGVYWTQATTSGNPVRVGIRPYLDDFSRLRCYSQSSPTSSPVTAGYATQQKP